MTTVSSETAHRPTVQDPSWADRPAVRVVTIVTFAAWCAFSVLKSLEHLARTGTIAPVMFAHDTTSIVAGTIVCVPLFFMANRFPLIAGKWRRHLPVMLVAVVIAAAALNGLRSLFWMLRAGTGTGVALFTEAWHIDVITMLLVVGIAHVDVYVRAQRREAMAAAVLHAELADARLRALQAQIRPHFLFNTLHTVAQLAKTGRTAESVRVVELLGDLLRQLLDETPDMVPLRDEIALAAKYLEIEQVRFADRLRVEWRTTPSTDMALVPPLVLQPLIENAVQHGFAPTSCAGHIIIAVRAHDDIMEITVTDDGRGLDATDTNDGSGVGIANTRRRLTAAFGSSASLQVENGGEGGVTATITVPVRRATTHDVRDTNARASIAKAT